MKPVLNYSASLYFLGNFYKPSFFSICHLYLTISNRSLTFSVFNLIGILISRHLVSLSYSSCFFRFSLKDCDCGCVAKLMAAFAHYKNAFYGLNPVLLISIVIELILLVGILNFVGRIGEYDYNHMPAQVIWKNKEKEKLEDLLT